MLASIIGRFRPWIAAGLIAGLACGLYWPFLGSPRVFDDWVFFSGQNFSYYATHPFGLELRLPPYFSLAVTEVEIGSMVAHRIVSLAFHIACALAIYKLIYDLLRLPAGRPESASGTNATVGVHRRSPLRDSSGGRVRSGLPGPADYRPRHAVFAAVDRVLRAGACAEPARRRRVGGADVQRGGPFEGAQHPAAGGGGVHRVAGRRGTALLGSAYHDLLIGLCARGDFCDTAQPLADRQDVRAGFRCRRQSSRGRLRARGRGFLLVDERSHSGGAVLQIPCIVALARYGGDVDRYQG